MSRWGVGETIGPAPILLLQFLLYLQWLTRSSQQWETFTAWASASENTYTACFASSMQVSCLNIFFGRWPYTRNYSLLYIESLRDWSSWTASETFGRSRRRYSRTLSVHQPLFWALHCLNHLAISKAVQAFTFHCAYLLLWTHMRDSWGHGRQEGCARSGSSTAFVARNRREKRRLRNKWFLV